jgi:uncharacterized protein (DUF433 family)
MLANWRAYIDSDPGVVAARPMVRGTRLAVDFFLELFAGWSPEQVLESYPQLPTQPSGTVFAFAAEATLNSSNGLGSGQIELNQII